MKLRDLEIEHFGVFSDFRVAFPDQGLQVIFGPNEAGKSTLLQLIRELLFGFRQRNPYAFSDHAGEMAASATVDLSDGSRIRFRRRKGRVREVTGENLNTGVSIDASDLTRLLGGAHCELFHHVFGFSLAELTSGEQSLQHANLSEALYGGALGGLASFQRVLGDLEREHLQLFSPTATKRPINLLVSTIRRQTKELRNSQLRPRDYERLEQEVVDLGDQVNRLRSERDELQRKQQHCHRLAQAVELWKRRVQLHRDIATIQAPEDFPIDGDRQYVEIRARCDEIAHELDDFQRDQHATCSALEKLVPRVEIIAESDQIQQLAEKLEQIRGFRRDIVLRRQEARTITESVTGRLRELDPTWTLEQLDRFRMTVARRAAIEVKQRELEELENRRRELVSRRPSLEADIASMQQQLEALANQLAPASLIELVDSAPQYRAHCEVFSQKQQERRDLTARLTALETRLNAPFQHRLENLRNLPVPLPAVVDEFRQQWIDGQQQVARCQQALDQAQADLDECRQNLFAINAQDNIPDRQRLTQARERRDQGWHFIQRKYIQQQPVDPQDIERWAPDPATPLVAGYQISVRAADQIADQRQQHAETVARQDQLADEMRRLEERFIQRSHALKNAADQFEQWTCRWTALWKPSGIDPNSPHAMLEWLRLHAELVDTSAHNQAVQGDLNFRQQEIDRFENELAAASDDSTSAPGVQLAEAIRRVNRAREAATERRTYESQLPRKQHQLAILDSELSSVEQHRRAWQSRWQPLMQEFGFPASWDIYTATRVLTGLSDARAEQQEAESLEQRVVDMQEGLDQFQQEVHAICQRVQPELLELPAETAVVELGRLLEQARQDERDRDNLAEQNDKLATRRDAKRAQLDRAQETLASLLKQAGVDQEEGLPVVARQVRHRNELHEQLLAIDHQLRAIRGGEERRLFEAALADADVAELESRQRMFQVEFEKVDQHFNDALQAKGVAVERLRELDSASQAATIAQEIEANRSQLQATVDRWASLVLAKAFLRRAMLRFEREHQPRLMVDVCRLFKKMTLGRYTGISRKLDEQGTLQVRQSDGATKEPGQLSTGTREQLYLAIRLAYILHYCRDAEPLPVVMDDVLVNFDDGRAAQTLEAILETTQTVQVILLTCHRTTLELVTNRLPDLQPLTLCPKTPATEDDHS